jgi:uncharacterized protein YjaZ
MQRTTVADYIVVEGAAESFTASLFGEDKVGYFITEFDPAELETARRLVGQGLRVTGFNVIRSYIFGDALAERSGYTSLGGMPTYGVYAIRYPVVHAFLKEAACLLRDRACLDKGPRKSSNSPLPWTWPAIERGTCCRES